MCKDLILTYFIVAHLQFELILVLRLMNEYEFIYKEIILMSDNFVF